VRKILWTIFGFWLCGLLVAHADTYQLTDGSTMTGSIVTFNDSGVIFRTSEDKYSARVSWTKFTQDTLKQMEANPKIKPYVEPFIEITAEQRPKKKEIKIHEVTRLDLPPKQSLIGAMFSSSVGIFALLLIYAANLYAGFEIAVVRARPVALVMSLAAVLPILAPIIFLSLPMASAAAPAEEQVEGELQPFAVPGQMPDQPAPTAPTTEAEAVAVGGLHIAHSASEAQSHPEPQIFQRGQFTFNRRFFETKFSGFFGVTRRAAEKDLVLVVKATKGQFVAERISRIAANDVHLEVVQGAARQEVLVPFADIQEIQLKHKDA
jgi:hypothetical protein